MDDYRGALAADRLRCSLQGGRYDCSLLSQVCTLKGSQGSKGTYAEKIQGHL